MLERRTKPPPAAPGSQEGAERAETVPALQAVSNTILSPRLALSVEREAKAPRSLRVEVDADHVRIGSHASNDVVLADPTVSRFHCSLSRVGGCWQIHDSGSLNGTRVDGVAVRDADMPRGGCTLQLGDSAVRVRELGAAKGEAISENNSLGSLHGRSASMRKLFALIERVAPTDATVLIEGESGTGKELVATEIVARGLRACRPFVIVDCGAIAPNLFESTLFGHCRGAFTGAERDKVGSFEAASGGTVFLDEIGEMPLEMQPKLLRVLQKREVCRVGETKPRPVDVRIIAATNRRLEREVNRGAFREDLYFRLSVITLRMPPLRERLEDLDLLVDALLESLGHPGASSIFDRDAFARMGAHDWPGNVRELRNFVERSLVLDALAADVDDRPADAPPSGRGSQVVAAVDLNVPLRAAKESLIATFEKKYLTELLAWADGNVSRAARRASMDRINLHRLVQRYGLRPSRSMDG